jgi:hypothetical protein
MSSRKATRSIVAIGFLLCAFLLERILTLGGITDTSHATQNPPLLLAIGSALIVLAVATAIAAAFGVDAWASISLATAIAYVVSGTWLRLANDDDSGAAIVVLGALIGFASWRALGERRRRAR